MGLKDKEMRSYGCATPARQLMLVGTNTRVQFIFAIQSNGSEMKYMNHSTRLRTVLARSRRLLERRTWETIRWISD
jgi:hypothetical protein